LKGDGAEYYRNSADSEGERAADVEEVMLSFDITTYWEAHDRWIAHEGVEFVRQLYFETYWDAALLQPQSITEIGVRCGYCTAAFLAACPGASYLGFDNSGSLHGGWEGSCSRAVEMLRRCFPSSKSDVRLLDTQAVNSLPSGPVNLVHIDGDHTYAGAMYDLGLAIRLMPDWILVDDSVFDAEVKRACKDFLARLDWRGVLQPTLRGDYLFQENK
jgi:predicted O-methyltransferase YrrM